jgi:hypothetical protein
MANVPCLKSKGFEMVINNPIDFEILFVMVNYEVSYYLPNVN